MSDTTEKKWVLPASIPFSELKAKDLEECTYWLLDAIGAKDLEWRVGGIGDGAADGGRDLEATFYVPGADGEVDLQKWWIECKGRSGTVDAAEVKEAVNNALAKNALDCVVVVTNTQFSNPTRDWVREWQTTHPRPRVKLWDHTWLERYLSRHPDVVQRLFAKALSVEGRLKAVESRFWNRFELAPQPTLTSLWTTRAEAEIDGMALYALIVSEFAGGNIVHRPWGAIVPPETAALALSSGLSNLLYLVMRGAGGIDQRAALRSLTYLMLIALEHFEFDVIASLAERSIYSDKFADMPDDVKIILLGPVADNLLSEMQDICSSDCSRMMSFRQSVLSKAGDEIDTYWARFDAAGAPQPDDTKSLRLEKLDAPCAVGFEVDKDKSCPLFEFAPTVRNVGDLLKMVQRVANFRRNEFLGKREAEGLGR